MAGLDCACGCGRPAPATGRRFIHGHNRRKVGSNTYAQLSKTKVPAGTRLVHRLRAIQALGRPLPAKAVVHHADGSRRPDTPLAILENQAEHLRLHARQRVLAAGGNPWVERICDRCRHLKHFRAFSTKPKAYLGLSATCRDCENRRRREAYAGLRHTV